MLAAYYRLTKPGIIYGNVIHIVGAIGFAGMSAWSWSTAVGVITGSMLVMASACVVNNIFDRDIDAHMSRTKSRPMVQQVIGIPAATAYAIVLGLTGLVLLVWLTNPLTAWLAIVAHLSYAFLYTWSKRHTIHSTLIGALPGAIPAVAGYTAMTGRLDAVALLLGLLIVWWQLAHFYAIAIFRKQEYRDAGIVLVSHALGVGRTSQIIMAMIGLYTLTAWVLFISYGVAGAGVLVIAGLWWFLRSLPIVANSVWAKKLFLGSLIVTCCFAVGGIVNLCLGLAI